MATQRLWCHSQLYNAWITFSWHHAKTLCLLKSWLRTSTLLAVAAKCRPSQRQNNHKIHFLKIIMQYALQSYVFRNHHICFKFQISLHRNKVTFIATRRIIWATNCVCSRTLFQNSQCFPDPQARLMRKGKAK